MNTVSPADTELLDTLSTKTIARISRVNEEVTRRALENSELGSIAGYHKYGIKRSELNYEMFHRWSVSESIRKALDKYYILKWKPDHLFRKLTNGIVEHQGLFYYAVYHECTRKDLEVLNTVSISFRVPKPEYKLNPILLISSQSTESSE